ncbi:MAG: hypothetical protein PHW69_04270 [Elusimicrobiaceae bacterium]|nr:hypothetical protein [Elusimicrobiaceae bacterium]
MNAVFADVRDFIVAPNETVARLVSRRRYAPAFFGYGAAAAAIYMWGLISAPESVTAAGALLTLAVLFVFYAFKGFVYAALAHAALSFLGARGSAAGLFIIMGITEVAAVLLVPLGLIAAAASLKGVALGGLFYFAMLVLQFYMLTVFIRQSYATSTGRALTALFTPVALLLGLAFALLAVLIALAIAGVVSLLA